MNEADVALTDVGLSVLAGFCAVRLATLAPRGAFAALSAVLMGGLASAALWGAVFHAFFPAKTATAAGIVAWIPVVLSIVVVGAAVLELALRVLAPRLPGGVRHAIVVVYAIGFAGGGCFGDRSFATIVFFYAPALLVAFVATAWRALRTRDRAWGLVAGGFAISGAAAVLQQARVSLDPVYFNHNAVYHVVQAGALVLLYQGFRAEPRP